VFAVVGPRRRAAVKDAKVCVVANGGYGFGALLLKTG